MSDCIGYHEATCYKCGVTFQMTTAVYNRRYRDGKSFYCPNGHGQVYSRRQDSEEKLEAEVARLKRLVTFHEETIANYRRWLAHEEKSRAAYQGHLHRLQRVTAQA